jgi:hypothetical protein
MIWLVDIKKKQKNKNMEKYNMTFEEAQEYISKRGFDIPWNDCDVFVDERYITQTVGNVLRWADNNPVKTTNDIEYTRTDAFIEKATKWMKRKSAIRYHLSEELIEEFKKAMKL